MPWASRCVNHNFKFTELNRDFTSLEEIINANIAISGLFRSFLERIFTLFVLLPSRTLLRPTCLRCTGLLSWTEDVKLHLFRSSSKLLTRWEGAAIHDHLQVLPGRWCSGSGYFPTFSVLPDNVYLQFRLTYPTSPCLQKRIKENRHHSWPAPPISLCRSRILTLHLHTGFVCASQCEANNYTTNDNSYGNRGDSRVASRAVRVQVFQTGAFFTAGERALFAETISMFSYGPASRSPLLSILADLGFWMLELMTALLSVSL